jgi:hypothetical protein
MLYKTARNKKRPCADYLIIGVDSKWKAVFDMIVLVFVGYSTVTSAFYVSFAGPPRGMEIFDYVVEFVFLIDLVLRFF